MKKDTDEQADEEAHSARSRRVPSTGVSVPVALGAPPSWYVHLFTNTEALKTPYFGDFWRLSHVVMNNHYFSSSQRIGGEVESSKFLIMTWSFW